MKKIISLFSLFAIVGCRNEITPNKEISKDSLVTTELVDSSHIDVQDSIVNKSDNSNTSLDWAGVYKGVTPCADCEGIATEITLNKDLTFVKTTQYLGKKNPVTNEVKGSFSWNSDGINITLNGIKNAPCQYLVGENKLFQLNMSGKRITGNLSSKYILSKVK